MGKKDSHPASGDGKSWTAEYKSMKLKHTHNMHKNKLEMA